FFSYLLQINSQVLILNLKYSLNKTYGQLRFIKHKYNHTFLLNLKLFDRINPPPQRRIIITSMMVDPVQSQLRLLFLTTKSIAVTIVQIVANGDKVYTTYRKDLFKNPMIS